VQRSKLGGNPNWGHSELGRNRAVKTNRLVIIIIIIFYIVMHNHMVNGRVSADGFTCDLLSTYDGKYKFDLIH